MALMQRSSFDRLPPETQQQLMTLVDKLDERQYQYAIKNLEQTSDLTTRELAEFGVGRKQLLWTLGTVTVLAMLAGTTVTCWLIATDQPTLAHTVMMSGLAVVSALLGGAGLASILQRMSSGGGGGK